MVGLLDFLFNKAYKAGLLIFLFYKVYKAGLLVFLFYTVFHKDLMSMFSVEYTNLRGGALRKRKWVVMKIGVRKRAVMMRS